MMFGLPYKIIAIAVCVIAVTAGLAWVHDHIGDVREASVRAEYAETLRKAEADAKEQRGRDQAKAEKLSGELEAIRTAFTELRNNPPKPETLVKIKEVPVHVGQTTCPVINLGSDFRLFYNAAASLRTGTD